jgi:phosphohistidine phosphatase
MANRELLILRHAKSSWDSDAPTDFERPLAKRGKRDCPRVGAWLAERGLEPDVVVSSPARRARQTARRVLDAIGIPKDAVRYEECLYGAGVGTLLEVLAQIPGESRTSMIVGHNPGLEELVRFLGRGAVPGSDDGKVMPTATVAHFRMPDDWNGLGAGDGELVTIMRPKWLPGE